MDEDAGSPIYSLSSNRCCDVDDPGSLAGQAPECGGTPMAEQGALSVGEDGCPPSPGLDDTRVAHGEDLAMHEVKAPLDKPSLDGSLRYSQADQLHPRDHPVLSFGQPRNLPPSPVSEFRRHIRWLSSDTLEFAPLRGRRVARIGGTWALLGSLAMAGDTISFARGAPSADILPREAVRDAAAVALAEDWEKALSYGTGIGHPGLCAWIAERHGGLDAGQVMVANGSLEAGWMLFEHLLEPGDRVVVEQPTYDRTLLMLQRLGVELVPVALEDDGLDLAAFEAALADGPVKLAHVIPNFHNPAGCTLSAEKRVRLVELAAEHGFWIFEDDPYRELPFEGEALETMLSIDTADRVIHASSFSKTVSPGVRVGYLAGPGRGDRRAGEAGQRDLHLAQHAGRGDGAGALPLRRPRPQHRVRQGRPARPPRRAGRGAARADPRGRVRRPRRRLLPLARPGRGHRHHGPACRGQGRGRRLRRRPRLHDRRWRQQPSPLLRQRAAGADPRGGRANRPSAGDASAPVPPSNGRSGR